VGCWRCIQRIDREIATPTAAGSRRSADVYHSWHSSAPGNSYRMSRCGAAIPKQDRTQSCPRDAHSLPMSANRTHLESLRSSLSP
jgi:hypothetical protein